MSLGKSKSSRDAANLMVKNSISSVVVSDSGRYVGIVTERDLVRKVIATCKDPNKATLGDMMSAPMVTIDTSKGLGEATSLMLAKGVRRLIAVENGKMVGIFSQRELQQKVDEVFRSLAEVERMV